MSSNKHFRFLVPLCYLGASVIWLPLLGGRAWIEAHGGLFLYGSLDWSGWLACVALGAVTVGALIWPHTSWLILLIPAYGFWYLTGVAWVGKGV